MGVPVVEGISPALTGGAEVIRRDPRHHLRLVLVIQKEELRTGPDIGAVSGDEYRQVSEEHDPPLLGISLQSTPLAVEEVLEHLLNLDCVAKAPPPRLELSGLPQGQPPGPVAVPARVDNGAGGLLRSLAGLSRVPARLLLCHRSLFGSLLIEVVLCHGKEGEIIEPIGLSAAEIREIYTAQTELRAIGLLRGPGSPGPAPRSGKKVFRRPAEEGNLP